MSQRGKSGSETASAVARPRAGLKGKAASTAAGGDATPSAKQKKSQTTKKGETATNGVHGKKGTTKAAAQLEARLAKAAAAVTRVRNAARAANRARKIIASEEQKAAEVRCRHRIYIPPPSSSSSIQVKRRRAIEAGTHGWGPKDARDYLLRGGGRTLSRPAITNITTAAGIFEKRSRAAANTDAVFLQLVEDICRRSVMHLKARPPTGRNNRRIIDAECVRQAVPEFLFVGPVGTKK